MVQTREQRLNNKLRNEVRFHKSKLDELHTVVGELHRKVETLQTQLESSHSELSEQRKQVYRANELAGQRQKDHAYTLDTVQHILSESDGGKVGQSTLDFFVKILHKEHRDGFAVESSSESSVSWVPVRWSRRDRSARVSAHQYSHWTACSCDFRKGPGCWRRKFWNAPTTTNSLEHAPRRTPTLRRYVSTSPVFGVLACHQTSFMPGLSARARTNARVASSPSISMRKLDNWKAPTALRSVPLTARGIKLSCAAFWKIR